MLGKGGGVSLVFWQHLKRKSHHAALRVCLMKMQTGLFLSLTCVISAVVTKAARFCCVFVSFVVSCLRLARSSEPPHDSPSSTPHPQPHPLLTTSSCTLLSCPVQTCIIYPLACFCVSASWSVLLIVRVDDWTWTQVLQTAVCYQHIMTTCFFH